MRLENVPSEIQNWPRWAFALPGTQIYFEDRPENPVLPDEKLLAWDQLWERLPSALEHKWTVCFALRPEDGIVIVRIHNACQSHRVATTVASAVCQKFFTNCYREDGGDESISVFVRGDHIPDVAIPFVRFLNDGFIEVTGDRLRQQDPESGNRERINGEIQYKLRQLRSGVRKNEWDG